MGQERKIPEDDLRAEWDADKRNIASSLVKLYAHNNRNLLQSLSKQGFSLEKKQSAC